MTQTTLTASDAPRLDSQQVAVRALMDDGQWRTVPAVDTWLRSKGIHATETSIAARIRALRNPKFGGYDDQRRAVSAGLFAYRAVQPEPVKVEKRVQKDLF